MSSRNANKNQVLLQGRHIESILSLKKIGNSRNKEDTEEEEAPQCRSPTKFPKRAGYLNLLRTKRFSTETTENSSLQRRKSRFPDSTFSVREREREI
jgi:hypothetical protein